MFINGGAPAYGDGKVYKLGKLCILTLTIRYGAAGGPYFLAGVPTECLPAYETWLSCGYYSSDASEKGAEAMLTTAGNINVWQGSGNKNLKIFGAYFTA